MPNLRWVMSIFALLLILLATLPRTNAASTLSDLDGALTRKQWKEAAEIAYEIYRMPNPTGKAADRTIARVQGAYALMQDGFPVAAISVLAPLSVSDWDQVPRGLERMIELMALVQKQVPLNVMNIRLEMVPTLKVSPMLRDEILFAKGRFAFESAAKSGDSRAIAEARIALAGIGVGSRYFYPSQYILGVIALQQNQFADAEALFAKALQPSVFTQSADLWNDLLAQASEHWGTSVRVAFSADSIQRTRRVIDMSLLALARLAYSQGKFEQALGYYNRIPLDSPYSSQGANEKIWTLFALGRHLEAKNVAQALASSDLGFEGAMASILRALVLADEKQSGEARSEVNRFYQRHQMYRKALSEYAQTRVLESLPKFLQVELARDERMDQLSHYQRMILNELSRMQSVDKRTFPVFTMLSTQLKQSAADAQRKQGELLLGHISKREADLAKLESQAHLIMAETFLDDREALRQAVQGQAYNDGKAQALLEHDRRVVELLSRAIQEVDSAPRTTNQGNQRELRQVELLWELASAKSILKLSEESPLSQGAEKSRREAKRRLSTFLDQLDSSPQNRSLRQSGEFLNAFLEMEVGEKGRAMAEFRRYLSSFPEGDHAPDALRILADEDFDENRFKEAQNLYKEILKFSDSSLIGYAYYKMGWCSYNSKDFPRSLLAFEKAVNWSSQNKDSQALNLYREARRDLISLYAEVGSTTKAVEYFRQFMDPSAQSDLVDWIGALADSLNEKGRYEKARDLYRAAMALDPLSLKNIEYALASTQGSSKLRDWAQVRDGFQELAEVYHSTLTLRSDQEPTQLQLKAEATLRDILKLGHFEFSRSKDKAFSELLVSIDESYLALFGPASMAREPLYLHAHLLRELDREDDAGSFFEEHWVRFGMQLDEKGREDAWRQWILSLAKSHSQEQREKSIVQTKEYLKVFTRAEKAASLAHFLSSVSLKDKNWDATLDLSLWVIQNSKDSKLQAEAFKNHKFVLYELKDWTRLEFWLSNVLTDGQIHDEDVQNEAKTALTEAKFLKADQLASSERPGEKDQAAKEFMNLADSVPVGDVKWKAKYNAFLQLAKSEQWAAALQISEDLEKEAPEFQPLKSVAGVRAQQYLARGDVDRAIPLLKSAAEGSAEAKALLLRIEAYTQVTREGGSGRSIASAAQQASSSYLVLNRKVAEFRQFKNVSKQDLVAYLSEIGRSSQELVSQLDSFIQKREGSSQEQVESVCSVSLVIDHALHLIDQRMAAEIQVSDALRVEVDKAARQPLVSRLDAQTKVCLEQIEEYGPPGSVGSIVLEKWGWRKSIVLSKATDALAELATKSKQEIFWDNQIPSDGAKRKLLEAEILSAHRSNPGTADSWFRLALIRILDGRYDQALITLAVAREQFPEEARILGALSILKDDEGGLEQAAKRGDNRAGIYWIAFLLKKHRFSLANKWAQEMGPERLAEVEPRWKRAVEAWIASKQENPS